MRQHAEPRVFHHQGLLPLRLRGTAVGIGQLLASLADANDTCAPARLAGRGTLCPKKGMAHACVGNKLQHGVACLGTHRNLCRVDGLHRHGKPPASGAACHMLCRHLWGCRPPQASKGGKPAPGATEPSDHDGPGQRLALHISPPSAGRSTMTGGKDSQGFQEPPVHLALASASRSMKTGKHAPSATGRDGVSGGYAPPQCTPQSKGYGSR